MRDRGYATESDQDNYPKNMWCKGSTLVIHGRPSLYSYCVHCAKPAEHFPEQTYNVTPKLDAALSRTFSISINVVLVSLAMLIPFVKPMEGSQGQEVSLFVPLCRGHYQSSQWKYLLGFTILLSGIIGFFPSYKSSSEGSGWLYLALCFLAMIIGWKLMGKGKRSLHISRDLGGNFLIRGICREYLSWFRSI